MFVNNNRKASKEDGKLTVKEENEKLADFIKGFGATRTYETDIRAYKTIEDSIDDHRNTIIKDDSNEISMNAIKALKSFTDMVIGKGGVDITEAEFKVDSKHASKADPSKSVIDKATVAYKVDVFDGFGIPKSVYAAVRYDSNEAEPYKVNNNFIDVNTNKFVKAIKQSFEDWFKTKDIKEKKLAYQTVEFGNTTWKVINAKNIEEAKDFIERKGYEVSYTHLDKTTGIPGPAYEIIVPFSKLDEFKKIAQVAETTGYEKSEWPDRTKEKNAPKYQSKADELKNKWVDRGGEKNPLNSSDDVLVKGVEDKKWPERSLEKVKSATPGTLLTYGSRDLEKMNDKELSDYFDKVVNTNKCNSFSDVYFAAVNAVKNAKIEYPESFVLNGFSKILKASKSDVLKRIRAKSDEFKGEEHPAAEEVKEYDKAGEFKPEDHPATEIVEAKKKTIKKAGGEFDKTGDFKPEDHPATGEGSDYDKAGDFKGQDHPAADETKKYDQTGEFEGQEHPATDRVLAFRCANKNDFIAFRLVRADKVRVIKSSSDSVKVGEFISFSEAKELVNYIDKHSVEALNDWYKAESKRFNEPLDLPKSTEPMTGMTHGKTPIEDKSTKLPNWDEAKDAKKVAYYWRNPDKVNIPVKQEPTDSGKYPTTGVEKQSGMGEHNKGGETKLKPGSMNFPRGWDRKPKMEEKQTPLSGMTRGEKPKLPGLYDTMRKAASKDEAKKIYNDLRKSILKDWDNAVIETPEADKRLSQLEGEYKKIEWPDRSSDKEPFTQVEKKEWSDRSGEKDKAKMGLEDKKWPDRSLEKRTKSPDEASMMLLSKRMNVVEGVLKAEGIYRPSLAKAILKEINN